MVWRFSGEHVLRAAEHREFLEPEFSLSAARLCEAVKRIAITVFAVTLALVLAWMLLRPGLNSPIAPQTETAESEIPTTSVVVTASSVASSKNSGQLLGESILRDYGNTNQPPENDLTLMSRLMENSLLLLKSAGNRPLSANEDWADLLRGKNSIQEKFISDTNVALNGQGQIIDRWGTPLFFHALGSARYEIRSAGPDKKLWTADDVHRSADGSFRRGADLNSPSLMEAATRGQSPSAAP